MKELQKYTKERIQMFKFLYPEESIIEVHEYETYTILRVQDKSYYKLTDSTVVWLGNNQERY